MAMLQKTDIYNIFPFTGKYPSREFAGQVVDYL